MNLDLSSSQRRLVQSLGDLPLRGSAEQALESLSGQRMGVFEQSLVFEEIGAHLATLDIPEPALLLRAGYAVGVARACLQLAQERASERLVGGRPLLELQGPAHRLANASYELVNARVGVWRIAWAQDEGDGRLEFIYAATAVAVTTAITCAHELVQMFGAAGTSIDTVVTHYETAYSLPSICGSPSHLWRSAVTR